MTRYVLPFPPSVNHYWRRAGRTIYISELGKAYRARVESLFLWGSARMAGPLEVEIDAHPPDKRERDLDNLLKAPLDALAHAGAYEKDSQIVALSIRWGAIVPEGQLVVTLREGAPKW